MQVSMTIDDAHPVFNPTALRFTTPAIQQLKEDLHRWLWTGATGALVTGTSRAGKTTALCELTDHLYTRGKIKIPTCFVSIPNRDQPTMTSLFRLLCLSMNLRVTNHDRADHLANRLIHYLADTATQANCAQMVLIVDEMQRLKARQFDAFAELYDELLRLNIRLMVLFVGNDPECWSLVEQIEQPAYAHIYGRFFNQGAPFLGLTSKAEVKVCLAQYDTLRYPPDGPTYTQFFLPEAFEQGWRFASVSDDLWRVFRAYQRNYKITSWGMQYFTATVNTLLTDYLPKQGIQDIDDEILHECIRLSHIIPSLVRPGR